MTVEAWHRFVWLFRDAFSGLLAAFWMFLATSNTAAAFQAQPAVPPVLDAKSQQIQDLVQSAMAKMDRGEWDAAIQDCASALLVDEKSGRALVARGMVYNAKGEYETALKDFDLVTSQTGREATMLINRADAYAARSHTLYQQGKYLAAIDSAYFATLEKNDHIGAHLNRAQAYVARRQYDKAVNSANRAINADEKSAAGYSMRGFAYGAQGNFDQALADENKALELDANLAVAYQRRAAAWVGKNDAVNASADFDKAIALDPSLVDALCDRAYFYALQRDLVKAMADLDLAIQKNPKFPKAHVQKGLALLDQERFDEAIACFDTALQLQDNHAGAHCYRGYALHSKGSYTGAVEAFTKAITLDPELVVAYSGRNLSHKKLKMLTQATADAAKVKELMPQPAPKKKEEKKKEEPSPRFLVKSKPVDPGKKLDLARSAAEVDRLVTANYAKHRVAANPKTTDEQFLRRIYLDVTGTIPTLGQATKFLATSDPEKRSALIDELLSSDGYASHWFNYWADVLRYTDSLNNNVRGEPYRQWIKQSLAESKPWDKFVNELLTAQGLVWKNPATGYVQRDSGMPLDNMNNTVRIFLGTRIGCAQCHDHPFDRWTQKEFYQMAAFTFGTLTNTSGGDTRYWEKNPNDRLQEEYDKIVQEEEDRRNNSYRFDRQIGINMMIVNDQVDRKISLPADYAYDNGKAGEVVPPKALFGQPADVRKDETPRQAFARWVASKENPRFAVVIANRLWKQTFGIGQIEPVDDMMDSTIAENPELMTFLESEMKRLNFDMKEYLRILYNTQAYQRQACFDEINPGAPYHFAGPVLRRMTAEQVWDSILTLAVPDEYRELPAEVRTTALDLDLTSVTAENLMAAEAKAQAVDGEQGKRQAPYLYKGVLLARASELPSPVPASHFLRMFGQSDRELISASSTSGSVPQVLFMLNGPISHMLLESNSTIYNNVMRRKTVDDGVETVFLTILNRKPDMEEKKLAANEITKAGPAGYGNVIWSLLNTREFLFIQ
ncbi:MAG: DUF1549 domain-containing protein [Planctomycetales bacterium]|nr:DUF1549 domain-containing protein [Planctomycetales bacterium]